jgi:hypothetical protein
MIKKVYYFLSGTYAVFSYIITFFVLFDLIAYGKVELTRVDLIIIGSISFLYFIFLLVKMIRKNKRDLLHRKGESWKE